MLTCEQSKTIVVSILICKKAKVYSTLDINTHFPCSGLARDSLGCAV